MTDWMTSAQHSEICDHCEQAVDGYYDQHVFDALHHHGGMTLIKAELEAARHEAAKHRKPAKSRRRNDDPLGLMTALHGLRQR